MRIEELYQLFLQHPSVQTDTRKLKEADLFFALKGDNFNGNQFALQALEKGAAYSIVDQVVSGADDRIIVVQDVLSTLQELSKYHRQQFKIPFIAITGSNGKTTTKELIHVVLSSHFKTYTTEGNLNNHIGIPLTLLKVKADAEIAVIEMGANHQKEIAGYCKYALPTHGLINNVGKAHLEGFGGIEGVKKGKGELYDYIRETKGTIFINNDFDYLLEMSEGIGHKVSYGTHDALTTGELISSEPFLKVNISSTPEIGLINTHLVGDYNLPNVLAAVCVGLHFRVPPNKIKAAIESYQPSNSRSQLIESGTNKIILDAYNANPSSMKLAIENFAKLPAEKKVLMLGAMAELGEASLAEHQYIIDLIQKFNWHKVVLVGGDFNKISHSFENFKSSAEARDWFKNQQFTNTHLLIKGSRSMKMEEILS
ncbi:UDP-N-acetylmuramoyl-tripeptide--D-alanyl-D-alanine ligase [Lacibacter sediminis]|uniref:UDP-N-acetylmuramoyl-tripeptide--D-alanyl-D-alanine ligase n=1 Tax=Lacibacter sediminis TaxID=2760713 RepID=A0A7G5XI49_9BACT|nr:UDP-N-acetylmuramoyl-tripeptide--D-alanyl-D-alanine ligase [Lacibacter sediminis]QNA45152.1 UDP-N-acetylmuramoyl-tripeptide--D-alanyl-D-alanine ligase [Lacibacter sediminis]